MLGRKQNIYLLLTLVLIALSGFFDLAIIAGDTPVTLSVFGAEADGVEHFDGLPSALFTTAFTLFVMCFLLVLFGLSQHKRIKKQQNVVYTLFLALLVQVALLFYLVRYALVYFGKTEEDVVYTVGIYLPVAALALVILTIRGIRADVELLKSIDRIR